VAVRTSKLIAYLAVAGVVAAGSFALPDAAGVAVRLAVGAAGVGTLVRAILVRRPSRSPGWWLVALSGTLAFVAAVLVATTSGIGSDQRLATVSQVVLEVGAMLALAAGLAVLGWRSPGSGRWDTLDTAIIATGAFLLAWVFYIDPMLARSSSSFATAVAVAVPAGALLIFALAVKIALGGAMSTWSGRILVLATAAALCVAGLTPDGWHSSYCSARRAWPLASRSSSTTVVAPPSRSCRAPACGCSSCWH
jgi:hypothetical protein